MVSLPNSRCLVLKLRFFHLQSSCTLNHRHFPKLQGREFTPGSLGDIHTPTTHPCLLWVGFPWLPCLCFSCHFVFIFLFFILICCIKGVHVSLHSFSGWNTLCGGVESVCRWEKVDSVFLYSAILPESWETWNFYNVQEPCLTFAPEGDSIFILMDSKYTCALLQRETPAPSK